MPAPDDQLADHRAFIAIATVVQMGPQKVRIHATARVSGKTGVEMEALTAVTVAALTVYDMCKAIDKTMVIGEVRLVKKTGGTKG